MKDIPHHLQLYAELINFFLFHVRPVMDRNDMASSSATDDEAVEAADKFARKLEDLGPTFIKFGQLLSTRSDILPKTYINALQKLQNDVEEVPFEELFRVFEEDLGVSLKQAFENVDATPIAAASLGQAHRAVTREGDQVIVKIQRPDIRDRVTKDLDVLNSVAEFADEHSKAARRFRISDLVEQFSKSIVEELDYRNEANNLRRFKKSIKDFPEITAPRTHPSFCSERVIVMDYLAGNKVTELSGATLLDVEGELLVDELLNAFLHHYIVGGFFHADPHPGNVILTGNKEIAFIDLGMAGRLSESMRNSIFQLFSGIAEDKSERVMEVLLNAGLQENHVINRGRLLSEISTLISKQHNSSIAELQFGALVMAIIELCAKHEVILPPEFNMVAKSLLNLDYVATILAPDLNPSEVTRKHLKTIARQRTLESFNPSDLFDAAIEFKELLQHTPHRLNNLLNNLADNKFRVDADVIDEKALLQGFQKIANRITIGVITASLVIGAGLMMRYESKFEIFGYPGIAMLLLFAAVGIGSFTVVGILRNDK